MSTGKKICNVLGIIFAWILSIALVILLFVSPVLMSAMSTVKPGNLAQAVQQIDLPQLVAAMGEELIGAESGQLADFLSTDAAQELYEVYVTGVFGALEGEVPQEGLTEEKLQDIVHRNIDQLYEICLEADPELVNVSKEEAKQQLETALVGSFQELTAALPSAEDLMQALEAEPEVEAIMNVLERVDAIKMSLVVIIVVLSGLIFACRLFGFRGFRWLSTDLFVATGLSGLVCAGLAMSSAAVEMLVGDNPAVGLLAGSVMSSFVSGVYIRTGIMLVSAILLLVVYLAIKKARDKKAQAAAAP